MFLGGVGFGLCSGTGVKLLSVVLLFLVLLTLQVSDAESRRTREPVARPVDWQSATEVLV